MMFIIDRTVWGGTSVRLKAPKVGHLLYRHASEKYGYKEQTLRQLIHTKRVKGGDGYIHEQSLKDYITGRT